MGLLWEFRDYNEKFCHYINVSNRHLRVNLFADYQKLHAGLIFISAAFTTLKAKSVRIEKPVSDRGLFLVKGFGKVSNRCLHTT